MRQYHHGRDRKKAWAYLATKANIRAMAHTIHSVPRNLSHNDAALWLESHDCYEMAAELILGLTKAQATQYGEWYQITFKVISSNPKLLRDIIPNHYWATEKGSAGEFSIAVGDAHMVINAKVASRLSLAIQSEIGSYPEP